MLDAKAANRAPVVAKAIADQLGIEDRLWTFKVPAGSFRDPDGTTLAYSATLAGGAALPKWLKFDAKTQSFSGRPPENFDGSLDLRVTASDGKLAASGIFRLTFRPTNDPVKLAAALPDRAAVAGEAWTYQLPGYSFADADGTRPAFSAKLASGSALPAWLKFDPATQTFTGTPPAGFKGALDIRVTAKDGSTSASDLFRLAVAGTNDAPKLVKGIADQTVAEDARWIFKVPAGTFGDAGAAPLLLSATLEDGRPLPGWLAFDERAQTFSGIPPRDFSGSFKLKLTASDGSRAAEDGFKLTVRPVADAPSLALAIADQVEVEDQNWSFALPAGTFTDPDSPKLAFSATLANGKPLPTWLKFDAATQTFSGDPPPDWTGALDVRVKASDGSKAAFDTFRFSVANVNDAPSLEKPLADVPIAKAGFRFTLPAGSFTDGDGTRLAFKATLADGSALPAWLKFDAKTQTFFGTAPAALTGAVTVKVTASDGVKAVSDTFSLTRGGPVVSNPMEDQRAAEGKHWSFTLETDLFKDFDTANLAISATLAGGKTLPSWLTFDAKTKTFSGDVPDGFKGPLDIAVTASDGKNVATDRFLLTEGTEFRTAMSGNTWGRDAPDALHFRFDDFFFESSGANSVSVGSSSSAGRFFGGYGAAIGYDYGIQAGLLIDYTMKASTYTIEQNFSVVETASKLDEVIDKKPFVIAVAEFEGPNTLSINAADPATTRLQAFLGLAGHVTFSASGSVYAGYETPDISTSFGTISIPDIKVSTGFDETFDLVNLPGVKFENGKVVSTDSGGANSVTGGFPTFLAIDLTGADPAYTLDFPGIDDLGSFSIKLPSFSDAETTVMEEIGPGGLGTLHAVAVSDPFVAADLDLDTLARQALDRASFGVINRGLTDPLFHEFLGLDRAGFKIGLDYNTFDLKLVGGLSLREELSWTPEVTFSMQSSFGQKLTGKLGDKVEFDTPEGEGTFTVDATYREGASLTTKIGIQGDLTLQKKVVALQLIAGFHGGPIDFDIPIPEFVASRETLELGTLIIPLYSNVDTFTFDEVKKPTRTMEYEKFRTVAGSGDDLTLTTHQVRLDANDHANKITGNALDNVILGRGGNDQLIGLGGNDQITGAAGDDKLVGGAGDDSFVLTADGGDDTVDGGEGEDQFLLVADTSVSRINFKGASVEQLNLAGFQLRGTEAGDFFDFTDSLRIVGQTSAIGMGGGDDRFVGSNLSNFVNGEAGSDRLDGAAGDDTLAGGAGGDLFAFTPGTGRDVVSDFEDPFENGAFNYIDRIDLTGYKEIRSVEDLTFTEVALPLEEGGGVALQIGLLNGDRIIVLNHRFPLEAGAFLFDTGPFKPPGRTITGTPNGEPLNGRDGDDTIDGGGGFGADTIDGRGGDDVINAGSGNDAITGGLGADRITSGAGSDTIFIRSVAESTAAAPDHILGHATFVDHIDLSAVDLDAAAFGRQGFVFENGDGFLAKGELYVTTVGKNIEAWGAATADNKVDFKIVFDNLSNPPMQTISPFDFIL